MTFLKQSIKILKKYITSLEVKISYRYKINVRDLNMFGVVRLYI